jgi:cytochrome c
MKGMTPHTQERQPMKTNVSRRHTVCALAVAALLAGIFTAALSNRLPADDPPASKADEFSPYVTKDGGISLPTDFREKFLHMGTWAVATKPGKPVDELHGVYARPEDVQAYRRDGRFPDGAVLVKDVTSVASEKLTTGQAASAKDLKIWFVMIKDARGRFPQNDLWGDGWGWALFEAKDPKKNVATDYKADCKVCHIPAKKDDWVYVQGYPVLKKLTAPK